VGQLVGLPPPGLFRSGGGSLSSHRDEGSLHSVPVDKKPIQM
jgi:hypothetical protein